MPVAQRGRTAGLDRKELAILRREGGPWKWVAWLTVFAAVLAGFASMAVFHAPHPANGGSKGVFLIYGAPGYAPFLVLFAILNYMRMAPAKKVLGFDPKKQNRAEDVVFWFCELRITRTELIKGYGPDAPRIPLRGLTATVENTGTKTDHVDDRRVDITINGPDTKFVYSAAANGVFSSFTASDARQFAALLNYEAGLLGAPQEKVQEKPRTTSVDPQTDAGAKSAKVRCVHCQHVQTVPLSQETFSCEQCAAHLMRR